MRERRPTLLLSLLPAAAVLGLGFLTDSVALQMAGVALLALTLLLWAVMGGW